jgi:hypothetical protein
MKMYGGMAVKLHTFLTSASVGAPCFSHLTTKEKAPSTHQIGSCVDPSAFLDRMVKRKILAPAKNQTPIIQTIANHFTD